MLPACRAREGVTAKAVAQAERAYPAAVLAWADRRHRPGAPRSAWPSRANRARECRTEATESSHAPAAKQAGRRPGAGCPDPAANGAALPRQDACDHIVTPTCR
ncbi:hypothetical protein F2P46_10965 [Massilia sp. CCM 8734]|nr:hypothetical protein [Massilia sp. CCM 8734]